MWLFAALGTKWSTVAVTVVLSFNYDLSPVILNPFQVKTLYHCLFDFMKLFPFSPIQGSTSLIPSQKPYKKKKETTDQYPSCVFIVPHHPIPKFKQKPRNTTICLWNSCSTPPSPWDLKFSDSKKIAQTDLFYCVHRVLPQGRSHQRFKLCYFCP